MQAMMVAYGRNPRSFEDIASRATPAAAKPSALKRAGKRAMQGFGFASVPFSAMAMEDYRKQGDLPGEILSGIETAANAAAMFPPLSAPASVVGLGAMGANMAREYMRPEYRSVMEDYK
jgi:hypothetical protein